VSVAVESLNQTVPPELSRGRRQLVLLICCMSLLLIGLDITIVNVALPSIHRSLGASVSGLQWTVDAYTLVIASLLILAGSTADRVGRKLIFRLGLLLFTLGSALCAAAPSLALLIVARVLQAVGASMLNPVALSIIRTVFTDPRERAAAVGTWSATVGVSMALGPVVGGALVDTIGWRFIFLVNVPVGIIALILTTIYVPESRAEHPRRIDPVGQLLVIVGLFSLVYAIIEGPGHGWMSTEIVSLFAVSIISLAALVGWELRHPEPLIEMRFFRSAPFAGASAIAVCAFAAFSGFLFLNTLYLQEARGMSAFDAGLCTLPIALVSMVLAPVSGRIVGTRGSRLPLLLSGLSLMTSPILLTQLDVHTPLALLLLSYVLFGVGFGMVNPPITNTALSGMPPAQAGVAAAIASTSRQVGGTLGIAVIGATVAAAAGVGKSFGAPFATATHAGWWIVAGLGVTILCIGLVTTSSWALETARATAARLSPQGAAG
jgi:EmrB/QacA subfamily drug resistance transporter